MNYMSTMSYREQPHTQYGDIRWSQATGHKHGLSETVQAKTRDDVSVAFLTEKPGPQESERGPSVAGGQHKGLLPQQDLLPTTQPMSSEEHCPYQCPNSQYTNTSPASCLPSRVFTYCLPSNTRQALIWLTWLTPLLFNGKTTASPLRSKSLPSMPFLG